MDTIVTGVHRCAKWMKQEVRLIFAMVFLVFLIKLVWIVALETREPLILSIKMASETSWFPFTTSSNSSATAAAADDDEIQPVIKGTFIVGKEAVKRFRDHLDCFSESGKWVYDPTPRHLPWNIVGDPYSLICDHRHHWTSTDNISDEEAEDIAVRGKPGNWSVREELKWVWQTNSSCPWRPIDRDNFCRKIGANTKVLIVGDSLNHEVSWSLMNALTTNGSGYERQLGNARMEGPFEMCKDIFGTERGIDITYICNVHLTTVSILLSSESIEQPWLDFVGEYDTKLLILNKGAHYQDDFTYTTELWKALNILSERYPHLHVIYRNTAPGHLHCQNFTRPLLEPQRNLPGDFHWEDFNRQNHLAKKIVEEFEYTYMDVFTMLVLRPEAHVSESDCLHYCLPSPLDIAVEYLYNILLLV